VPASASLLAATSPAKCGPQYSASGKFDQFADLRARMLKNLSFEAVYEDVMTSATAPEQVAFTEAVWSSYVQMHDEMRMHKRLAGYEVCQRFLALFAHRQARGVVFTLNQDLLIEPHRPNELLLSLPGAPTYSDATGRQTVTLPTVEVVEGRATRR
jgi:hypothetical protein